MARPPALSRFGLYKVLMWAPAVDLSQRLTWDVLDVARPSAKIRSRGIEKCTTSWRVSQ